MLILNWFRRRSPASTPRTEDWPAHMLADFDRLELCGVELGQPIDRLGFLSPTGAQRYEFPGRGLLIDAEDGHLDGFTLALRPGALLLPSAPESVHAFAGRIRIDGREIGPGQLADERDFIQAWGPPYHRDEDEDEVLLFYEFRAREVQVELSRDGEPLILMVTANPLMSDPDQRQRYGVTRPWPPR